MPILNGMARLGVGRTLARILVRIFETGRELMNLRRAAVVESRFLGALEMADIAQPLGISEATVLRVWRAAQAVLAQEVRRI